MVEFGVPQAAAAGASDPVAASWSTMLAACSLSLASTALSASTRNMAWLQSLQQKLLILFKAISLQFSLKNFCIVQAWICWEGASSGKLVRKLYTDPVLVLLGDGRFNEFRSKSMHSVLDPMASMPGRVWRTGAVQVVQNAGMMPPGLHPRGQMSEGDLSRVAEVIYIPLFDMARPNEGPQGVLEAVLSRDATDPMLVANFISFVGATLLAMRLSLCSPAPHPVHKSCLAGRRLREAKDEDEIGEKCREDGREESALGMASEGCKVIGATETDNTSGVSGKRKFEVLETEDGRDGEGDGDVKKSITMKRAKSTYCFDQVVVAGVAASSGDQVVVADVAASSWHETK